MTDKLIMTTTQRELLLKAFYANPGLREETMALNEQSLNMLQSLPMVATPIEIDGNTSDGYHTFNELYEFRKMYNAALFNEWAACGKFSVHKSWKHHSGELCFDGGWFIVVTVLPKGQISNHYKAKDWDLFAVPEVELALFEYDGHTGTDVLERLKACVTSPQALTDDGSDWFYQLQFICRVLEGVEPAKQDKATALGMARSLKQTRWTAEKALAPITADDVTQKMILEFENNCRAERDDFDKIIVAAYNAVIKHRSEAK